jgi:hypothetical protein
MSAGYPEMNATARAIGLGGRARGGARPHARNALLALSLAALAGGLLWLVWIYGNGLRDPRYFDGWLLAAGMGVQIAFHIATKSERLSPRSAARWRKLHIFLGFLLIAAFASHVHFSLPDTGFEWALATGFVLVALSGWFGVYLAWSLRARGGSDERLGGDRIATRRAELAREVEAAVARTDPAASRIALPTPPYDAWIADLYVSHLRDFFAGPRNLAAHLVGSRRPVKRLTDEIDDLSHHVDQWSREKLAAMKSLVVEKDRLDASLVHHALAEGWLLVHVPVTYALTVLAVLHVVVVYAFSSGNW